MRAADTPEFDLHIDAHGRVTFQHPRQAHAYLRQYAGQLIVGKFYPVRANRSARQSRAFHAMVTPWLHCEARGGWSMDALKLWVLGEVFGYVEFVRATTGEVVRFPAQPHTSTLSVAQFSELIERTLELAAEDGVWLQAPGDYRKGQAA